MRGSFGAVGLPVAAVADALPARRRPTLAAAPPPAIAATEEGSGAKQQARHAVQERLRSVSRKDPEAK